jgi:DNA-binding XRE family transcriptional regulator
MPHQNSDDGRQEGYPRLEPLSGVIPDAGTFLLQMSTNVYKYGRMILVNYRAMEVDVETLQEMRINQGLSQRQLADKAGLSPGAVWMLEQRGSGRPATLKKVADVLGVRPTDLLKKGR